MAYYDIPILQPHDLLVKDLFSQLEHVENSKTQYQVTVFNKTFSSDDYLLDSLISLDSYCIRNASINRDGFSISYQSLLTPSSTNGSLEPHTYLSTLRFYTNDSGNRPTDDIIVSYQAIIDNFITHQKLRPAQFANNKENLLDPQIALLSAIQSSAAGQISRTNEFFSELTTKFDERNQSLNKAFEQKRQQLESDIAAKADALKVAEQALEVERKELDDRSNTHARRRLRSDLVEILKDRQSSFSISPDTMVLRRPIHWVFISLLTFTFLGTLWSLYVWGTNSVDTFGAVALTSAVKTAVFTFGFLTTAGLYISWMNRWFDKHAEAQFQTKQLEIDINRASWAVEAALEWKSIQQEQMPDVLLAGITKHLFEFNTADSAEYSPLEALATSILGSASNLNLDLNGNKMILDRKSIQQIKRKSE